ncbi:TPA: hypothetical protein CPT96_00130 [Candidatus Gastranaerophilales bacterium HUM_10]|nr:MAG TPA: hypothetical protein CPT96_00130 [Candidatus Gastranaerophilales bacterium HUM_10]
MTILVNKLFLYKYSVVNGEGFIMAINPVMLQFGEEKFPEIYSDYKNLKNSISGESSSNVIFEGLPMYGRINSIPDKLENKDYTPAMGLVSLAVLNGPEDLRDVMSAYKQIKDGFKDPHFHSGYDNKIAQHPFSFFRGTIMNDYLNPSSKDCPNPKAAAWIIRQDKTLWDTKLGNWVQKKLGIEVDEKVTQIQDIASTSVDKKLVLAKVFKTNNPFKDILARAMTRTPVLGVAAMGGIEAAHVAHEVKNGKNFFEESGKSLLTLGTTLAATGILGAIGAKHLGPTGSLAGIGLGAISGAAVNRVLD